MWNITWTILNGQASLVIETLYINTYIHLYIMFTSNYGKINIILSIYDIIYDLQLTYDKTRFKCYLWSSWKMPPPVLNRHFGFCYCSYGCWNFKSNLWNKLCQSFMLFCFKMWHNALICTSNYISLRYSLETPCDFC